MSRILAIEPDPERGRALTRFVRERVNADVVLAPTAEVAIAAIEEQVPDLILTSALMSPSDDVHLTEHFERLPDLWRLPILTIPPVIDPDDTPLARNGLLSLFKRKTTAPWPAYDHDALGTRIEEALRQSREAELSRQVSLIPRPTHPDESVRSQSRRVEYDIVERPSDELLERLGLGVKRSRAHRWMGTDLPWLSTVKLPWGLEVTLVNISNSGMLIESGSKLTPGSATTFQLWGPNKQLLVPGRVVRSRVAEVSSVGVRYHAAAIFDRKLELPSPTAWKTSDGTPKVLVDLLVRVRNEAARGAEPAVIRNTFELGVQELVTARDIRIRNAPLVENDGSESVYFSVPTYDESSAILQATFEPNHLPRAEEFEVLKAAATVAARVLEIESSSQRDLVLIA